MTSAKQFKANRANARVSTGPRTQQGRARSAQNARRHGFSVSVESDPLLSKDAEALARALAGGQASVALLEAARRAAEAHIDLVRIRRARHDVLLRKLNESKPKPEAPRATDPRAAAKRILELLEPIEDPDSPLWKYKQALVGESQEQKAVDEAKKDEPVSGAPSPRTPDAMLTDIPEEYYAFERYERRALSRRKFAIRELDALRQLTTF
jgi:hypothetical protein